MRKWGRREGNKERGEGKGKKGGKGKGLKWGGIMGKKKKCVKRNVNAYLAARNETKFLSPGRGSEAAISEGSMDCLKNGGYRKRGTGKELAGISQNG